MIRSISVCSLLTLSLLFNTTNAQPARLTHYLNDSNTRYLSATFTGQIWLRYNQSNPGSTVNGYAVPETYDIGIRRARMQLYGKIHERVFFYSQLGINNFGYNSQRKPGLFFHDLISEFYVTPRALQVGAGLTAWTGYARYSSPGVASILAYDAPLYQQATNDANDQFLRKLSVYAKGKLNKLDYRLVLSKPLLVDAGTGVVKPLSTNADFSWEPPKLQGSGYMMYQFMDEESNLTPYTVGTYLGKKKVFNIGAGFQYQPGAMWRYADTLQNKVIHENMLHYSIDVFYDQPLNSRGAALTAYAAASRTNYGYNYIRNNGAMNPAPGASINGGGSAFPTYGTGTIFFAQLGYLLPRSRPQASGFQPYADLTYAQFDRFRNDAVIWDAGINWLIDGPRSKVSINYQNRPVFGPDQKESDRKSCVVLQLQIAI